jgi:hypothetical protein
VLLIFYKRISIDNFVSHRILILWQGNAPG